MAITKDLLEAAIRSERAERVPAAVLLAVALVETNGRTGAPVGQRVEPLIRFEGHYFDRLLNPSQRRIARAAGLSHPKAGQIRNPAGQEARWRFLERAASIDRAAAWQSTSWGLGQVMGAHWKSLGFGDVEAMVASARASIDGQLTLMARFLKIGGLAALLTSGDAKGFARRYNGPNYQANGYDAKIAAAYRTARRALPATGDESA